MGQGDYIASRDADLLAFSANLSARISAAPTAVGLVAGQATAYTVLHDAFASALALVTGGENSTPNVVAKNQARANLISGPGGIRELVRIIQAFPGTTDIQRAELLITIPDVEPSPIPAPGFAPAVSIVSVSGRTVRVKLKATQSTRRGKPDGVIGASIVTCVSETEPTPSSNWTPQGNTSLTVVDLSFPESVESGAKVWISAVWLNPRMESGPPSTPIATNLPGGAEALAA